jgi:hypothetical protein
MYGGLFALCHSYFDSFTSPANVGCGYRVSDRKQYLAEATAIFGEDRSREPAPQEEKVPDALIASDRARGRLRLDDR